MTIPKNIHHKWKIFWKQNSYKSQLFSYEIFFPQKKLNTIPSHSVDSPLFLGRRTNTTPISQIFFHICTTLPSFLYIIFSNGGPTPSKWRKITAQLPRQVIYERFTYATARTRPAFVSATGNDIFSLVYTQTLPFPHIFSVYVHGNWPRKCRRIRFYKEFPYSSFRSLIWTLYDITPFCCE